MIQEEKMFKPNDTLAILFKFVRAEERHKIASKYCEMAKKLKDFDNDMMNQIVRNVNDAKDELDKLEKELIIACRKMEEKNPKLARKTKDDYVL